MSLRRYLRTLRQLHPLLAREHVHVPVRLQLGRPPAWPADRPWPPEATTQLRIELRPGRPPVVHEESSGHVLEQQGRRDAAEGVAGNAGQDGDNT